MICDIPIYKSPNYTKSREDQAPEETEDCTSSRWTHADRDYDEAADDSLHDKELVRFLYIG